MNQIKHYLTEGGQDLYQLWLEGLNDRMASARIFARINRLAAGALGDCKPVGRPQRPALQTGCGAEKLELALVDRAAELDRTQSQTLNF